MSGLGADKMALVVKNLPASAGDLRDADSIPELRRSPGDWHGNPLQYSCLESSMDRGAWWAQMSGQVLRGSAVEYQADERAGVAGLSWRVSGR